MTIHEMSQQAKEIAEAHGFTITNFGESVALAHSELSEALEAHRKPNDYATPEAQQAHIAEELADTVIRVGHLAAWLGVDLENAVIGKMERNRLRPYKHGGKAY